MSDSKATCSRKGTPLIRRLAQFGFALGAVLTAVQFHAFVASVSRAAPAAVAQRPAEVEAWLPISSLVSLAYLVRTGIANTVHPAGLVLFTLILLLAFTLRRGFCSWVCPIGTLAEYAHRAGRWLFKRNLGMPKPLDFALRSVKYLLLSLFVVLICRMSADELRAFIHSPYNRVCDVKMYALFAQPSTTTLTVVSVLGLFSLFFKNFWCRYLCPYGALLGLASMPSPTAVRRDPARCTGCGACTAACPNGIRVHARAAVRSPECTACYGCVTACPSPAALSIGLAQPHRRVSPASYALVLAAAFSLVPHAFRALGYWETDTPAGTYRQLIARLKETTHPPYHARQRDATP